MYLKDWRPICLLNVIYKIPSGCIVKKLMLSMDKLMSGNQIGETIGYVCDLRYNIERKNIPDLLNLIDF